MSNGVKIQLVHKFEEIISVENLLLAWKEFIRGKRGKRDVQEFQLNLMANILGLYHDLKDHTYWHGGYQAFWIFDPKPRKIHKAIVRDRLLHHAIYRILYPLFESVFIADSFSCRLDKGTHKAMNRFRSFAYQVSRNNTRTCWILKCDIRKFFENIDHEVLMTMLARHIPDPDILWLLGQVIGSFSSKAGAGLPLGNLTSQLLVNIYMNKFDQLVKHKLKAQYYVRYADDFVIFSEDRDWLVKLIEPVANFLENNLKLSLHPDKVFIKTIHSGVDFLGWVHFHDHRVLRTTTKNRMIKRLASNTSNETLQSYSGLLAHGNTHKIRNEYLNVT